MAAAAPPPLDRGRKQSNAPAAQAVEERVGYGRRGQKCRPRRVHPDEQLRLQVLRGSERDDGRKRTWLVSFSAVKQRRCGRRAWEALCGLPKFWKYFLWQKAGSEREVEILNGLRDGLRLGSSQACTIPELEMITPATRAASRSSPASSRSPRDEYAPGTINLQFLSTAQH